MTKQKSLVAMAAAVGLWTSAAHAADNLKIGLIATLSGPPAVLGQQLRNGFSLAVKRWAASSAVATPKSSLPTTSSSPTSPSARSRR